MVFTHDVERALRSAVFLVNSSLEPDTLSAVADLTAFYTEFDYTGSHRRTREELDAVRALRPQLRALLLAPRDECVRRVNTLLEKHQALPQLRKHDAFDWHLHAIDDDQPLASRIAVETAMAMIDVIRADEHSRITICADTGCDGIVLDLSRNRSKIYCSLTCGNRQAAAAYRARQRS